MDLFNVFEKLFLDLFPGKCSSLCTKIWGMLGNVEKRPIFDQMERPNDGRLQHQQEVILA